jgi:hypothetical protein
VYKSVLQESRYIQWNQEVRENWVLIWQLNCYAAREIWFAMPTSLWVAEAWGWGSGGWAKSSWVVNNEKGIARAAFEWVAGARTVGCGEIRK